VADGPQSVIEAQVRNGVAIRMALIHRALAPTVTAGSKAKKRGKA
jgi:aspartate carbamoyltransferase catalytic subunit